MSSEQLKFKVGGFKLLGVLEQPNTETTNVVIVLHPHPIYGGNMYNPVVDTLVNAFLDAGYATFRFDFRGAADRSCFTGVSGAVDDCIAASKLLDSLGCKLVGIAGYSFGGSTALRFSSNAEIKFLISVSSSLDLIQEDGYSANNLTGITCPVLMLHGISDMTVPYDNMYAISTQIGGHVKCVTLENEGHFYHRSLSKLSTEVRKFIENL